SGERRRQDQASLYEASPDSPRRRQTLSVALSPSRVLSPTRPRPRRSPPPAYRARPYPDHARSRRALSARSPRRDIFSSASLPLLRWPRSPQANPSKNVFGSLLSYLWQFVGTSVR